MLKNPLTYRLGNSLSNKSFYFLAGAFLLLIPLYLYHAGFPARPYFDEIYHVKSAQQFLHLEKKIYDTSHPQLGKLLMSLAMRILGDVPTVWRLVSLLCGLLSILALYQISALLMKNSGLAFLTAAFFAVDGLHFTQSRIAMLNASMELWMLLSILAILPYFTEKNYPRTRSFFAAGLFIGLATATRWVGVGVLALLLPFLIKRFMVEKEKGPFVRDLFLCLGAVPLLVYVAAHLYIPVYQNRPWKDIWKYQEHMFRYHASLQKGHRYGSAWWQWPLLGRPIWYFYERTGGSVRGILCIGNPAIYWMIPFAIGYVLLKFIEEKKWVDAFILVGFFSQWLPWMFIGRAKFFHYFYPALPFAIMAIVLLTQKLWMTGKLGKVLVIAYLITVVLLFVYWYPLYTGMAIPYGFFRHHMWFRSWI